MSELLQFLRAEIQASQWQTATAMTSLLPENFWEQVKNLVAYPGSSSKFLRALSRQSFKVQVLAQTISSGLAAECQKLQLHPAGELGCRESLLSGQQQAWMLARAVWPLASPLNSELLKLGNNALGDLLFSQPSLVRSDFEFACSQVPVQANFLIPPGILILRRSLFTIRHTPLLLTEIFLPDLLTRLITAYENCEFTDPKNF